MFNHRPKNNKKLKGRSSPWARWPRSEETKQKLRLMNVGRKHTPEAISKIKKARSKQVIVHSDITKLRISESVLARNKKR